MTEVPSGGSALSLVGQIARILNSGLAPDETLRLAAETIQRGLGSGPVVVWRREANASTFAGVTASTGEHSAASLDELPPQAAPVRRYPLVHGGARLGVLQIDFATPEPRPDPGLIQILADLLAPFLDAMTLSEDLALEVASRSREI